MKESLHPHPFKDALPAILFVRESEEGIFHPKAPEELPLEPPTADKEEQPFSRSGQTPKKKKKQWRRFHEQERGSRR